MVLEESEMRRVQFARGPWECFPDGHPPEKRTEEERRAYRCGLTIQNRYFNKLGQHQQNDQGPSFFDQSVNWYESAVQATSLVLSQVTTTPAGEQAISAAEKINFGPDSNQFGTVNSPPGHQGSNSSTSPYASSAVQASWPGASDVFDVNAQKSSGNATLSSQYETPDRHDSAASLDDFNMNFVGGNSAVQGKGSGMLQSKDSDYLMGGEKKADGGSSFIDIPMENYCAPMKGSSEAMCLDMFECRNEMEMGITGQVAMAYPCNFCGMNVKRALAGMLLVSSALLAFAVFNI